MKIKILIVVFLFSVASFWTIRQEENNVLWSSINNSESKYYHKLFINLTNTNSQVQKFYDILIDSADEHNLTLMMYRGNFDTGIYAVYYYNQLNMLGVEFPVVNSTNSVDFSNLEVDDFYSTVENADSSGYLFNYFHDGVNSFEIHNFNKVINNEVRLDGGISISGSDEGVAILKEKVDSEFGNDTLKIEEVSFGEDEPSDPLPFTLMLITGTLLILVVLHEVSKKAKEITIRRISGEKLFTIYGKIYGPMIIGSVVYYLIINLLLFMIFVGTYNNFVNGLILGVISYMAILLSVLLGTVIIVFCILAVIPKHSLIKNKSLNKFLYMISYIIKIGLIVTLLPSLYAVMMDSISNFNELSTLRVEQKQFSYLTEATGVFVNQEMLTQNLLNKENEKAQNELYDYENSYVFYHIGLGQDGITYDVVAVEYSFYERFLVGELPQIEPNQTTVIKKYENAPLPYNLSVSDGLNEIIIKEDFKVPYSGGVAGAIENPVLIVYPAGEELMQNHSNYVVKNISRDHQETLEIREVFNKRYEGKLIFGGYEHPIRQRIVMVSNIVSENLLLLSQAVLTILFVIILGNSTLIATKDSELTLMLVLGYSNVKRKLIFLSSHILVFVLSLYILLSRGTPLVHAIIITSLIVLVDYCVISYAFMKENTNVLRILKKG